MVARFPRSTSAWPTLHHVHQVFGRSSVSGIKDIEWQVGLTKGGLPVSIELKLLSPLSHFSAHEIYVAMWTGHLVNVTALNKTEQPFL